VRVLITGATGFIGGAIARALLRQGHELVCAVRDPSRLQWGDAGPGTWRAVTVDLSHATEPQAWQPHLSGVDAVINAVGIIREQAGQTFDTLHHRAPAALFQAAAAAGVRIVVQISALGADAGAQSRYHRTKKAADDALRALPVAGAVLQPSIVYGDSPGAAMFNLMATSPLLAMPQAGGMQVQPVHVDDVVDGVLAVLREPPRPVATVACVGCAMPWACPAPGPGCCRCPRRCSWPPPASPASSRAASSTSRPLACCCEATRRPPTTSPA
jgi:uncharacterized protein YbjT (DUF2867 family)